MSNGQEQPQCQWKVNLKGKSQIQQVNRRGAKLGTD